METAGLTRSGALSALGLQPRLASSLHRAPVWRAGPSPFSSVAFGGRAWALLAAGDPRGQLHRREALALLSATGPALLPGARPLSLRPRAACPRPSANFYLTADTP